MIPSLTNNNAAYTVSLSAASVIGVYGKVLELSKKGTFVTGSLDASKKFNPDWDPLLHPKDAEGKFVEKNKGTYIFGQNKKAVYINALHNDVVNMEYTLEPGDKAYLSSAKALLIVRADGTFDYVSQTNTYYKNISDKVSIVKAYKSGELKHIDSAPSVEIKADSVSEAKAALNTASPATFSTADDLNSLPVGYVIATSQGTEFKKLENGKWQKVNNPTGYGSKAENLVKYAKGGIVTAPSAEPVNKAAQALKDLTDAANNAIKQYDAVVDNTVQYVNSLDDLNDLPVGTKINLPNGKTLVKLANGKWRDVEKPTGYGSKPGSLAKYLSDDQVTVEHMGGTVPPMQTPTPPKVTFEDLDTPAITSVPGDPKVGDVFNSAELVNAAPVGTTIKVNNKKNPAVKISSTQWTQTLDNGSKMTYSNTSIANAAAAPNNKIVVVESDVPEPTPAPETVTIPKKKSAAAGSVLVFDAEHFPKTDDSPVIKNHNDLFNAVDDLQNKVYWKNPTNSAMDYINALLKSKKGTADILGSVYALDTASLSKGQKTSLTHMRKHVESMYAFMDAVEVLKSGADLTPAQQAATQVSSATKNKFDYFTTMSDKFPKFMQEINFNKSLKDLPFDLNAPSKDAMLPWVKEKGLDHAELASVSELTAWIKMKLNHPNLNYVEVDTAQGLSKTLTAKVALQKVYDLSESVLGDAEAAKAASAEAKALALADAAKKKKYDSLPGSFKYNNNTYFYDTETNLYQSYTATSLTRDDVLDLRDKMEYQPVKYTGSIGDQAAKAKVEQVLSDHGVTAGANTAPNKKMLVLYDLGVDDSFAPQLATTNKAFSKYLAAASKGDLVMQSVLLMNVHSTDVSNTVLPLPLVDDASKAAWQAALDDLLASPFAKAFPVSDDGTMPMNQTTFLNFFSDFSDDYYAGFTKFYDYLGISFDGNAAPSDVYYYVKTFAELVNDGTLTASNQGKVTLTPYVWTEPEKPSSVTDADWTLAKALLSDDKGVLYAELKKHYGDSMAINAKNIGSKYNFTPSEISMLPDAVKTIMSINSSETASIKTAVQTLFKSGYYSQPNAYVWTHTNGSQYLMPPGTVIAKVDEAFAVYSSKASMETPSYIIQTNGSIYSASFGYSSDYSHPSDIVFTAPGKHTTTLDDLTYDDLPNKYKMNISGSEFATAMKYIKQKYSVVPDIEVAMSDSQAAVAATLPEPHKNIYAYFVQATFPGGQRVYAYLSESGLLSPNNLTKTDVDAAEPFLNPFAPYAKYVGTGQISPWDLQNWPSNVLKAAQKDFGETDNSELADKIATFVGSSQQAYSGKKLLTASGMPQVLALSKTNKSLDGMHSKTVWKDQLGNEWMSKSFASDPNGPARVDAEYAATQIGALFGFKTPETRLLTVGGNYSYVQHLAPANGHLRYDSPASLNDEQLAQAMEEHILDWIVSNHDSHAGNLLKAPDGKSIIGIDKGQAFRFFPDDKLAAGYRPHTNPEPVWYDQFYDAIKSGDISEDRANFVATRVLSKALRISKRNDAEYRALLEKAFAQRDFWPDSLPTKDAFIDALVERKQNVLDDFEALYKNVFAKSPYKFTIDTNDLASHKVGDESYVALHPEYVEAVKQSGVHGKAVFFNSQDVADAHALNYTEKTKEGTDLVGQMKLRFDADALVTAWLEKQTIVSEVHSPQVYEPAPYVANEPAHSVLPGNDLIYGVLAKTATTVNHHAEDGEYNKGTLSEGQQVHAQVKSYIAKIEDWVKDNPTKVYPETIHGSNLLTHEQQDAYLAALKQYDEQYTATFAAKDSGQKTYNVYPKPPKHFQKATYTASDAAKKESSDVAVSYTATNGAQMAKTKDNGHFYKASGGKWVKTDKETYDAFLQSSSYQWKDDNEATATPSDPDNVEVVKDLGSKEIKIFKRQVKGTKGKFDPETGVLVKTGDVLANDKGGYSGYTGTHYEIEYGDISIDYKPAKFSDVQTSQRRWMRYRIKNWDGSQEGLENVYEIIRQMGVDLTPADETSLELHYWRHMYNVLMDRKESKDVNSDWYKTIQAIQDAWAADPGMSPDSELTMLKGAWALSMGQDAVNSADWMPQFEHLRPTAVETVQGSPFWYRPDATPQELRNYTKGRLLHSTYNSTSDEVVKSIIASGGFFSTEERLRLLGKWTTGMSSQEDQGKDGANVVFTRQAQEAGQMNTVLYHPRVMLRTQNYSFYHDYYGASSMRHSHSYFDIAKNVKSDGNSNSEFNVKNQIGVLDNVVAMHIPNSATRNAVIQSYKARGIFTINGIPIEQVFVASSDDLGKNVNKVWDDFIKEGK